MHYRNYFNYVVANMKRHFHVLILEKNNMSVIELKD